MGCDIHAHVEVRQNGRWLHWATADIERDYRVFERMAGVRGDKENAIALPRGLPYDISETTQLASDMEGSDGHSHSFLSLDEMVKLESWMHKIMHFPNKQITYLFGDGWSGFLNDETNATEFGITDARLVFWFDN